MTAASFTAIAWKMNERNLVNETYNEKVAYRGLRVIYLEEQLVDQHNSKRRLVVNKVFAQL